MKRVSATLFALAGVWISPAFQGAPGRARPPDAVDLSPQQPDGLRRARHGLDRSKDATTLTIATDSKTTERVTIRHPESADPDKSFLLKGKPFASADWDVIAPKGTLREGIRANAWVCSDRTRDRRLASMVRQVALLLPVAVFRKLRLRAAVLIAP